MPLLTDILPLLTEILSLLTEILALLAEIVSLLAEILTQLAEIFSLLAEIVSLLSALVRYQCDCARVCPVLRSQLALSGLFTIHRDGDPIIQYTARTATRTGPPVTV